MDTSLFTRADAHRKPGPPFNRAPCSNLESPLLVLRDGAQPQLFGSTIMYKRLAKANPDPIYQVWEGTENLGVYQTTEDAEQAMASLTQLAMRCRDSV